MIYDGKWKSVFVKERNIMKTIRLLYPDYVSGGLDTYYFGANLLQYILPQNPNQPVVKVDIVPPDGKEKVVTNGIYAEEEVLSGIRNAQEKIAKEILTGLSLLAETAWYHWHHLIICMVNMKEWVSSGLMHIRMCQR